MFPYTTTRSTVPRVLHALAAFVALASAPSALSVQTLIDTAHARDVTSSIELKNSPIGPALEDVLHFPRYAGEVNATAALRNRAFSLPYPTPARPSRWKTSTSPRLKEATR